jgi:predicted DNA-binding transcriptional regulator AlpA
MVDLSASTLQDGTADRDRPIRKPKSLPETLAPRGLSRIQAAQYIGVSHTLFDKMVEDERMPKPKHINARRVWDRLELDEAFEALPTDDEANPWDD